MAQDKKAKWLDDNALTDLKTTLGNDVYTELLNEFFAYCTESSDNLKTAFATKDFVSMEHIAHNLKSTSLVYGLTLLSSEAAQLEEYSRNRDIAKTEEVYNNLKNIWTESLRLLKAK